MTPARSLRSAALSRLSHESAATPTSVSGTPGTTASPFSKQHPGLLKCLTFYRTQSGLLLGAGTPNLCFFFYKQKDDSCRSTGTVRLSRICRQASQPPLLLLSVFWSLGEMPTPGPEKFKRKTKLPNEPSAFGLQPPCSSSHLLGTEAPGRFWG